jgi:hypothetical protein
MQSELDTQATPCSPLTTAPDAFGDRSIDHALPFQRSTSVTPRFEPVTFVPTARHEEALVHVPNSSWPLGAFGFGVDVILHPDVDPRELANALAATAAVANTSPAVANSANGLRLMPTPLLGPGLDGTAKLRRIRPTVKPADETTPVRRTLPRMPAYHSTKIAPS